MIIGSTIVMANDSVKTEKFGMEEYGIEMRILSDKLSQNDINRKEFKLEMALLDKKLKDGRGLVPGQQDVIKHVHSNGNSEMMILAGIMIVIIWVLGLKKLFGRNRKVGSAS